MNPTSLPPGTRAPALSLPVTAYGFAETLRPRDLVSVLPVGAQVLEATKALVLAQLAPHGWAAIHAFGALVVIGCEATVSNALLQRLAQGAGLGSQPYASETFVVDVQPGAATSVTFDRVVLPAIDAASVALVSYVIGQSVAMEKSEAEVDALLTEADTRARSLAGGGHPLSSRALLPFVGRAMTTRTQAIGTLALLDAPAAVWESEELDALHRSLRRAFDVDERYRGLDHKLNLVQDNLALLVSVAHHRRSVALEVAVIVLIALELLLGLAGGAH